MSAQVIGEHLGYTMTKGSEPQRVAPAAGLNGNGGQGRAAGGPGVEERRDEAALAFAASIVESSDDAIIGKTLNGMITSWNAGAERLYGYAAREVIGRWPIGITIPEDELPEILKRVRRGEWVEHYETVGVRKDGRRVDVSVTMSPIRDVHGTIVGALSIARDITHRKEAEAAIRERDTVRHVASLAAAAGHEINNPLAAAMGHIQLLAGKVDAKGRGRIDQILDDLSQIQEIVARMNRVTRIQLTDDAPYLPGMLDLSRSTEPSSPDKELQT
jgi:PAS domain S-box-containing protein